MIEKLKKVEKEFHSKITESNFNQRLQSYSKVFEISKQYLEKLKTQIAQNVFQNDKDEISYFKEIKPNINSQVIFYKCLIDIESQIPLGSIETKKAFLESRFIRLVNFHEENRDFIKYFRSQNSNLDKLYFLRKHAQMQNDFDLLFPEIDKIQSTGYDLIIANLLAYEKLEVYIQNRITQLVNPVSEFNKPKNYNFNWTDSKIDLVELIYAITAKKSINDGNVDIIALINFFSSNFNISLEDSYRTYQDIKNRKNSKTKFIESLNDSLLLKIDKEDELS